MKICIMTSAHPPLDARIFYKEACSLSKAGYEVVLIAPYPYRGSRIEDRGSKIEDQRSQGLIRGAGIEDRGSQGGVKAVGSGGGGSPFEARVAPSEASKNVPTSDGSASGNFGSAAGSKVESEKVSSGGYPKEEIVAGIRIRYVPPFQGRVQRILNLKAIYQAAVAEQADVYHFHDPDLIFTGLTLQKRLGKPVIYDVHEYYADSLKTRYWLPAPLRKTAAAVFDRIEKNAAKQLAAILTVNHHMEGVFKKYNPVGASLFNFPLQEQFRFERPCSRFADRGAGIEGDARLEKTTGFAEKKEEEPGISALEGSSRVVAEGTFARFEVRGSRIEGDLDGNSKVVAEDSQGDVSSGIDRQVDREPGMVGPVILYLGGINKERGLEVILEAMPLVLAKHPKAICQLVGPVDLGGLSERFLPLENWLAKGSIQALGKVPYSQVPGIMRKADIALVPLLPTLNYTKAIPVKLIEYMAAGLPVVGSRFGYIEKILSEDECGRLAEPGNPESLAKEICYLIENPDQALRNAQKGWDAFHEKYSWESEEKKLLAVYKEILG